MKIAVSSTGNSIVNKMDQRFGRCKDFAIYDTDSKEYKFIENPGTHMQSAAASSAAELIADNAVCKVVSGNFGPKAENTLKSFGITMINAKDTEKSVKEIINDL